MEEGLFGLYSWYGDKLNKRENKKKNLPSDPRYVEKEFNNITELKDEIKNKILDHLRSFTRKSDGELYSGIKSFEFQNCKNNCDQKDKIAVQDIINKTYFVNENGTVETDTTVDWIKLNILRRMKKRGYTEKVAEKYVNDYAEKSKQILERNTVYGLNLDEKHIQLIERQSKRTCDQYHNNPSFTHEEFRKAEFTEDDFQNEIKKHENNILLEELLIPQDTKQMILSSNEVVNKYKLNPKAIINPWISSFNTGYMSWNMIINKASISCLLNKDHKSSDWLFPVRLILEKNPNDLFFENCFEQLNNKEKSLYLGFFLIRYDLTKEIIPDNVEEECKHLYSFAGSKPHRSNEQYYVMFVFKNLKNTFPPCKYFIVNFRCNKIPWGDTGELTKIPLVLSFGRSGSMLLTHNIGSAIGSIPITVTATDKDFLKT